MYKARKDTSILKIYDSIIKRKYDSRIKLKRRHMGIDPHEEGLFFCGHLQCNISFFVTSVDKA